MSHSNNPYQLQNFGRIDLKPEEFDRAIFQKGARIIWEKSVLCSCLDVNSRAPDFTCPACYGRGYVYFDAQEIRAVVTGVTGDKNQIPIGLLDVGTTMLTTRAQDEVGFRDRLIFKDFKTPYSQVLDYDPSGIELKYACIEFVTARLLNTEIPLDMITFSDDKKKIFIDQSFGLSYGDKFSILYRIQPNYIVIDIPHELRGSFVKFGHPDEEWSILPRQFLLKREDLLPMNRGELI